MDIQRLREEARAFGSEKLSAARHARQVAAMQLMCGIDLSASLLESGEAQARLIPRIERMIERERLKGMRRHWSYDLNRHIALKQVLDRLRQSQEDKGDDAGHSKRNAPPGAIPGKVDTGFPSGIVQKQGDKEFPRFGEKRKDSSANGARRRRWMSNRSRRNTD